MKVTVYIYICKFHSNQTRGGWSIEGIIQDGDPSPPAVICNSTHLTSFSVLVSASSEAAEVYYSMLHNYLNLPLSVY